MTIDEFLAMTDDEYASWVLLSTKRDQEREDVLRGVLEAWERELDN